MHVHGVDVEIITDFRDYIRLLDMIKSNDLNGYEKQYCISQYFVEDDIAIDEEAIDALTAFVAMDGVYDEEASNDVITDDDAEEGDLADDTARGKRLFSYTIDYPYILSGFLRDYGIDLESVEYMHWWKFRALFEGLSDDTEIKQRIMYRGIDLSDIKNKEERKRISKIQRKIQLPAEALTDYDIGNAFV